MIDDEDEYYDSETEPSFTIEEEEISDKLNDLSFTKSDRRSILPNQQYYAIQILNKNRSKTSNNSCNQTQNSIFNRIFINKENAMKLCKQDPDNRRFKLFRSFQEAYAFSYEASEIESGQAPSEDQVRASLSLINNNSNQKQPMNISKTPDGKISESKNLSQDAEKLPFSAPKKPEVNEMRLFIEKNNFESFRDKVVSNPRFLITAGDAPVIYQEGFRYNALHVCAKENRANFCQLILNLLNSTAFLQKMYRNDTQDQSKARSNHLLDLYLNTPEKGLNETPLHFAAKFGSYEVARLLMSCDICCKNAKNKFGKTPNEMICTKATNETSRSKAEAINNLFEQCFYVPLFRDDDKGDVIIEKPSAKLTATLDPNETDFTKNKFNSPNLSRTNSQCRKLAGYVGPISPNLANEIYERLKSPAKLRRSPLNLDILRSDDYKGYERILRKITDEMNLPWCEYWGFLDSYCNLKSQSGLEKLELYLKQKKILTILDSQVDHVQTILNDHLDRSENTEENSLVQFLKQFLIATNQFKLILDLKENLLSIKYEKFFRLMLENEKNLPKIKSDEIMNEEKFNHEQIIDVLNRYMSTIIELSRLDKTSKCYFNLYKTSKILLDYLGCSKLFENFHMSPLFKKLTNPSSVNRPLTNATNTSVWSLRDSKSVNRKKDNQLRKALFNESDEDDDDKNENPNKNSDSDEKDYDDADDSVIDSLKQIQLSDDLELLTLKLNSNSLNDEKINTRRSLNPFGSKNINYDDDLGSNKNWMFSNKTKIKDNYKLFMYGDTPSKLDRAVYLAIQDSRLDSDKYVILNEWFEYMRNFKQSDMQKWRTPMRQNGPIMRSKSFNRPQDYRRSLV
ncbi:unnamed protein product [Brachionus calyciflorus]|uniref:ANKLE2 third alpha/beta domain-containing protein n=1 Tax=Brachionus calyciflorus TaxID=104777 RepID=A0A813M394_9BILA|nr:unnamed protein product [Brachionus calyciflorus]